MRPSRSWVPITFEGLLILSHSQRRIFRCVPHSMPNRLAGYLHTLSSYIRSREQRETISGGFFSMRSNGSSALSHTRALSKGKKKPVWLILASWEACLFPLQLDQMGRRKKRRSFHYTSRSWLHHIKRQKACQSIAMKTDKKKKPSLSMVTWSRIACCIDNVASKLVLSKFSIENCSE